MPELKTDRPFQQRFLDGFGRSGLRDEVARVKPRRFKELRKTYTTLALGASLAIGGIGVPLEVVQPSQNRDQTAEKANVSGNSFDEALTADLRAAQNIANQVAGGIAAAAWGVEAAAVAPLSNLAIAPKQLAIVTEAAKEHFFRTEVPFGSIIYREAKKNDLKPELVAAVVQAESRFKPTARSNAGALGLMQLVPKTGRWMGALDLTNPVQNIAAGTRYLKYLHGRFDGNEEKVIAAYNAGEGNVKRFGGVPPFRETRNYVAKVRNYEQDFSERVDHHVTDRATDIVAR